MTFDAASFTLPAAPLNTSVMARRALTSCSVGNVDGRSERRRGLLRTLFLATCLEQRVS